MSTRWFVEVSRVDADTQKERYCVEALQWQQALQQARKLRGDRGALSRFAIELLESGYRATDPGTRLRYTISKAPNDAPLSGNSSGNGASKPPPAVSVPATAPSVKAEPPRSEPPPRFDLPKPPGYSKPPGTKSSSPPRASVTPATDGSSPGPLYEVPRRSGSKVPTSPAVPKPRRSTRPPKVTVKKPPNAASETSSPPDASSAKALPLVVPRVIPSVTPPLAVTEQPVLTPTTELTELDPMTGPAAETAPRVPGLELVAMRKEEPTEAVPITYREYSFALAAGAEPHDLERHARAAWEQVRDAIRHRTSQKFVQIALFDHHFEGRPSRPPLAVLAWKDWRGEPVVQIRGAGAPSIAPASSASILPRPSPSGASQTASASPSVPPPAVSVQPVKSVPRPAASVPAEHTAAASPRVSTVPSFPAPQAILSSPSPSIRERTPAVSVSVAPAQSVKAAPPALSAAPEPAVPAASADAAAAVPAVSFPAARIVAPVVTTTELPAPSFEAAMPAVSVAPNAGASLPPESVLPVSTFDVKPATLSQEPKRSKTPSRPGSNPPAARKRRPSEDVISDLFDQMHSLHFAPDIVSGADYVLNVMLRVMPSDGVIIHVFDINTRQFVVVRAAGPTSRNLLLYRTPDTYRLFRSVFRRPRALAVADATEDLSFQSERWGRLGVGVKSALVGAVKQGGRYLGVIELANPAVGGAYQESDVNALDYICGQFAEFVASRPIVIDEDAVLPKT